MPNIFQSRFFQNKKIRISLIAILILVVGLGGYYGWRYSVLSAEPVEETVVINPDVIVEEVKDFLRAEFTAQDFYFVDKESAPYWAIGASPLYVNYTGEDASGFDVIFDNKETPAYTSDDIAKLRTDIVRTATSGLESMGLNEAEGTAYTGQIAAYTGNGVVCTLDSLDSTDILSPVTLLCGSTDKYTPQLASYKAIAPFLDSYIGSGNSIQNGDTFTIQPGSQAKFAYEKAIVSYGNVGDIGGAELLFYKQSGDDWKFFTATQGILACSDYNTSVLRGAFKGDACYTKTNTESKVQ